MLRTSVLWTVQGLQQSLISICDTWSVSRDRNQYKTAMGGVPAWQGQDESKHWQYGMIQILFTTFVVPVIAVNGYYCGIPWSLFSSPSSSPSLELSHVATKTSFTSAEEQKEAESRLPLLPNKIHSWVSRWRVEVNEGEGIATPERGAGGRQSNFHLLLQPIWWNHIFPEWVLGR